MRAGMLGRERGCAGTWGICERGCESRELGKHVLSLVTLQSSPAQEEVGTWLSALAFDTSPVHRRYCRQRLVYGRLCVRPRQCPVRVCVSLGYGLAFATG